MKLKANYLSLTGYRLPTEAEMEYATRAGAGTARYYGETEELLPKYAWYIKNSEDKTWPVGSLKPNDWGLFDVQGHVHTWCQDRSNEYARFQVFGIEEDKEDKEDINSINNNVLRVTRGGAFGNRASDTRSSFRFNDWARNENSRGHSNGFRPARTCR
jgi:formylglycine-generating enzyme required for sulfatase activity